MSRRVLKRLLDVGLSGTGLLASAPLWPIIAAAIKADSRGPIFYGQSRVGEGGRHFMVLKFRVTLPMWRIAKLIITCTAMYVGVRFVGSQVPPLLGIVLGVPLGVAIFVVLMRTLRCLDSVDRERLRTIASLLPARIRGLYRTIVDIIVPARPSDDTVAVART